MALWVPCCSWWPSSIWAASTTDRKIWHEIYRLASTTNLTAFCRPDGRSLVATIHFSPSTCCFRRFFRRSFMGSFRNENAEFTQSLLCSLFTKFTGECNHSHVHSLFTANGSSERSSIHVSIGDTKTAHFIENKQTKRSGKGGRITMRCRGFIPITNHANDHYSLSSVHSEWFANHSNHIHIFTPITRIMATKGRSKADTILVLTTLSPPNDSMGSAVCMWVQVWWWHITLSFPPSGRSM